MTKKTKLKQPVRLEDLAALAKMSQTVEWKTFVRMCRNRVVWQKDHIVNLPEKNQYLAVEKAYDRGVIAGILICIKQVETASAEMEKLAEKEENV
jgi:GH25 family lysozyme M1 (1,4-beta-N-acetylmuramidase)